jgi:hypothetical protein
MQLRHRGGRIDQTAHDLYLFGEIADVSFRAPVVVGDDLVARAVVANGVAERQMQYSDKG